jgi:cytochrome P450 family 114
MAIKYSIAREAQEVIARLQAPGLADPYPLYAWLREHAPIVYSDWHQAYLLSRYSDCARVFRTPHQFTSVEYDTLMELMPQSVVHQEYRALFSSLIGGNPLPYTPIRRLLGALLTPDVVRYIRDGMRRISQDVVDIVAAADDGNPVDLHNAVSVPVSRRALSALIGASDGEQPEISKLVPQLLRVMQAVPSRSALTAANTAFTVLADYLTELLASRRSKPQKDLATMMVLGGAAGRGLSDDDVRTTLITLWAAGFEKSVSMIDTAVLAMLRQPELIDWVRDEETAAAFVDELSRWDSPGQISTSPRYAVADTEIGGEVIPEGAEVRLLLGAANRDPEVFPEPDRLLPGRGGPTPLASGAGFQLCVGTSLARLQMCVLLPGLVERFPELHLSGEPQWRRSVPVRELRQVTVRLGEHTSRRSAVAAGSGMF